MVGGAEAEPQEGRSGTQMWSRKSVGGRGVGAAKCLDMVFFLTSYPPTPRPLPPPHHYRRVNLPRLHSAASHTHTQSLQFHNAFFSPHFPVHPLHPPPPPTTPPPANQLQRCSSLLMGTVSLFLHLRPPCSLPPPLPPPTIPAL